MSNAILQGTTPSLTITINPEDFAVTDVVKLELVFQNGPNIIRKALADVTTDADENAITYTFTEAETLALRPQNALTYQLRFSFQDGSIVGTRKASLRVEDLISEAVMANV